ncbi:MAG TPA: DUF1570 domain-containing protein [Planctomycetota bacterium]
MRPISAALLLLAPAASFLRPTATDPAPGEQPFVEARELLDAGKADAALARAMEGLSGTPYATAGYQVLADIAAAKGDAAAQSRWLKWLYWSHLYSGRTKEAEAVGAQLAAFWDGWNLDGAALATWSDSVEKAARAAAGSSRQYRVAGHLLGKLLDLDPADADLEKQYAKLYERAGDIASGGAFVAERVRRRSPLWVAQQNRVHSEWDNAFERNTKHYRIITNIDYEFYETVSVVMEDMYSFYQDVYSYNKKSPLMTLAIHRKRSDFDKYCIEMLQSSLPLGVLGWFYNKKMILAAFEDEVLGTTRGDLWSTLFHEASHQFMYLLCEKPTKQDVPTWLNEGTASYFEGCELKADGSIVKNKPALLRVREWESIEGGSQRHSLEELITQDPRRSYDGSFYSYGWALVYFLQNYENEAGERVYREPYLKYMRSYTKPGPKNVKEHIAEGLRRAKEYFVEEVGDPEVRDWDAFEGRWRRWMQNIVKESKAGPELADTLQERTRTYLQKKDWERALIAAEQADDKRPGDTETYRLLALASHLADRKEDAVYWMLRHWEGAWMAGDEAKVKAAEAWLGANEGDDVRENYCVATRAAAAALDGVMDQAVAADRPVFAMLAASHGLRAFGVPHQGLLARIDDLREGSMQDLRLWLRAFPESGREPVRAGGQDIVRYDPDGVLVNNPEDVGGPTVQCDDARIVPLTPPFDVRGKVQIDGKQGGQLLFGIPASGRPQAAIDFRNGALVRFFNIETVLRTGQSNTLVRRWDSLSELRVPPAQKIEFQIEVDAAAKGKISIGSGGQHTLVLPEAWNPGRLTGALALAAGDDTLALFSGLEVRTRMPFWPVEPPEDHD